MAIWWVNQRHTFDQELAAGILWAPKADKNGNRKSHWTTMTEVRVNDTVLHYASQRVVALSLVTAEAVDARRPNDLQSDWEDDGRLICVAYRQATRAVHRDEIPKAWRTEHSSPGGPFKKDGGVNQGYLFRVDDEFGDRFLERFGDRFEPVVLPAEAHDDATNLLRRLLGRDISTIKGRHNRVLEVQPPYARVATDRSPDGQLVSIAEVDFALRLLRKNGRVSIDPDKIGHRSSFIGAALMTLPSAEVIEGRPPSVAIRPPGKTGPAEGCDQSLYFDGDLNRPTTATQRREQASLRQSLLGSAAEAECSICGETYPVRFLITAHIKLRSLCSDDERLDKHVAMLACQFGCDALYETGYISVGSDGKIVTVVPPTDGALANQLTRLAGRSCGSFTDGSRSYFEWHFANRFLG
ncbi:hypothetical protein [Herbidospora sp. NBRC 101105]|uniref:hypothetical protein n=1 Tax=Herbidospora sp. NBRC 101105 TaxID=3032195 RepID=UPI0024A098DC|nr:hypothetical protein [Herbidospora sp. NBRC 101105]GLX97793.1 hypothetical protein Hesp01_57430 [Herbidospora sp. NBRC 101105]